MVPLGEEGEDYTADAEERQGAHQVPLSAEAVQGHHEDEAGQGVDQGRQIEVEEYVARNLGRVQGQTVGIQGQGHENNSSGKDSKEVCFRAVLIPLHQ